MKKNIFYLLLITLAYVSCEKDDICLLPTTPKLIIKFNNSEDQEASKDVKKLSIWAEGKDTISTYQSIASIDSIAIPLDVNAEQTIYYLKINNQNGAMVDNQIDTLTISYEIENIFVSRSCGYKSIFNNVHFETTNQWISSLTPNSITSIDNETAAHIYIFH